MQSQRTDQFVQQQQMQNFHNLAPENIPNRISNQSKHNQKSSKGSAFKNFLNFK